MSGYIGCPQCGYTKHTPHSDIWETCPNCKESCLYDIKLYDVGISKSDLGIAYVQCLGCGEPLGYEDELDEDEELCVVCEKGLKDC